MYSKRLCLYGYFRYLYTISAAQNRKKTQNIRPKPEPKTWPQNPRLQNQNAKL